MIHTAVMSLRILAALLVGLFARPALAQDTHDVHVWTQVVATVPAGDSWLVHLEAQPRWHEDVSEAFQVITRVGVGRRIGRGVTAWGGYAWIAKPPGPGVAHEHRLWQQLSVPLRKAAGISPSLRFRLEQRWQNNWADMSSRLRIMGRAVRPVTADKRWSAVVSNELMVTFDETNPGPWQGVDQNRLFLGTLRQFSKQAGLEFGYIWVTLDPPTAPRFNQHVAFAMLNLTL